MVEQSAELELSRTLAYRKLAIVDFAEIVLLTESDILAVLRNNDAIATIDWLKNIPQKRRPFVFRSLVWLLKLGVIKLLP
jgi:hypothetical protein